MSCLQTFIVVFTDVEHKEILFPFESHIHAECDNTVLACKQARDFLLFMHPISNATFFMCYIGNDGKSSTVRGKGVFQRRYPRETRELLVCRSLCSLGHSEAFMERSGPRLQTSRMGSHEIRNVRRHLPLPFLEIRPMGGCGCR